MGKDSYALITGLFMATLIAAIVIIIIWLGDVQQQTQSYVAETRESVTGLKTGSTVYYRGIEVGNVSAIGFDPDDRALIIVTLEVNKGVILTRGVYATLKLQGVTGLTQIALNDNGDNPELLPLSDLSENRIPIKPSLIDRLSVSGEGMVKETHEMMLRLNRLLNDKNVQHVGQILINVESATGRFITLQDETGKALSQVPALAADARYTLTEMNSLAGEFKQLSRQLRQELTMLSKQSAELMQTGTAVGQQFLHTTLPRAHTLMLQMQAATRHFDHVTTTLETNPQALLLGAEPLQPAPGEPDFKELQ